MTVEVSEYIAGAPAAQQPLLRELDAAIRAVFPGAILDPKSYFPVYTLAGRWVAGFATRKKGAMFYCLDEALLDRYADRLGKSRSGKTCVEYRALPSLPLETLRALVPEILAELAKRLT